MKLYRQPVSGSPVLHEHTVPVYVVYNLDEHHGPATGVIERPIELDWTPSRSYDLESSSRLRTMYSTVMREARSESDLTYFLNSELLIRHWPDLRLSRFIRESWERI